MKVVAKIIALTSWIFALSTDISAQKPKIESIDLVKYLSNNNQITKYLAKKLGNATDFAKKSNLYTISTVKDSVNLLYDLIIAQRNGQDFVYYIAYRYQGSPNDTAALRFIELMLISGINCFDIDQKTTDQLKNWFIDSMNQIKKTGDNRFEKSLSRYKIVFAGKRVGQTLALEAVIVSGGAPSQNDWQNRVCRI